MKIVLVDGGIRPYLHGSKFEADEALAAVADAFLPKQHWASGAHLDEQREDDRQDQRERRRNEDAQNVQPSLPAWDRDSLHGFAAFGADMRPNYWDHIPSPPSGGVLPLLVRSLTLADNLRVIRQFLRSIILLFSVVPSLSLAAHLLQRIMVPPNTRERTTSHLTNT